ncbi:MAG: hypothetical protein R6U36_01100, partial [Candidatus Fermentibacteraceae bacterium]
SYVSLTGANLVPWASTTPDEYGLVDVRESRFLRPASTRFATLEPVRVARIAAAMRVAADAGSIVHLWWHPHNFGANLDANLANLRTLLESFERLREERGFASYAMADVAAVALARRSSAEVPSGCRTKTAESPASCSGGSPTWGAVTWAAWRWR